MKNISLNQILIAFLLLMGIVSCEDRDIIKIEEQTAPIVMDVSADKIVLDKTFPNNTAFTINWEQAKFNIPVENKYRVEISANEKFEPMAEIATVDKSQNFASFTTQQLNEAVKKIGLVPYTAQKMYVRVVSFLGTDSVQQISNVSSITITPYLASPTYEYKDLFLIGSSTAAGWDNAADNINLLPLLKTSDANVYTFTGYFLASGKDGGFKIIRDKGSWDPQFGYGGAAGTLSSDGGSGNIPVPADGYYKLDVNTKDLTYTLTPVAAPAKTYTNMSIIGTVNGNWDTDTQLTQSTFDPNLWIGKAITLKGGEFKFRANNAWDVSWGTNAPYFGKATQGGANIPLESEWTYNVYFNDATGEYSVIPVK